MQNSTLNNKAIISLVLGIISGGLIIILGTMLMLSNKIPFIQSLFIVISITATPLIMVIGYLFVPLVAAIGLICGIQSLKSTKKSFAIAGIILCIIGLIVPIISFLFY